MSSGQLDEMCVCPYDATHQMLRKNLQKHLVKCGRNHPNSELRQCPFNSNHLMPEADYVNHVTNCPDKGVLLDYTPANSVKREEDEVVIKLDPIVDDENWDDCDDVLDYNPSKHILSKNVVRMPSSLLTKSEKKEFYKAERKRLGGADYDSEEDESKRKKEADTAFYKYSEITGEFWRVKSLEEKRPKSRGAKIPNTASRGYNSSSSKHPCTDMSDNNFTYKAGANKSDSASNEIGRYTANTSSSRGYGRGRHANNNRQSFQEEYRSESPINELYRTDNISSSRGYGRGRYAQRGANRSATTHSPLQSDYSSSMSAPYSQQRKGNNSPPPPPPFITYNHADSRNNYSREDSDRRMITNFSGYGDRTQRSNHSESPPPPPPSSFNRQSSYQNNSSFDQYETRNAPPFSIHSIHSPTRESYRSRGNRYN